MKRTNIFMLAYIVFIFLCAWIKPIYDFPMWERIVIAITTASWAFAISDCCLSISSLQKEIYETHNPLVDTARFRINQIKEHILKRQSEEPDESAIEIVDSCKKRCENLLGVISKMNKTSKIFEIVSIVITFFAFLLFLCTLSFDPVYNFFFVRQEGFTVLSFGMILLAQFLTNIGSDYINNIKKEFAAILNGWEALLHSYETEEKHNAD